MGVLISVALAAAIGLALLARSIAAPRAAPVVAAVAAPQAPVVRVLVARHDLAPGDRLTQADFNWVTWPADGLNPAFITNGAPATPTAPQAPGSVKIETAAVNAASEKAQDLIGGGAASAKMVDAIVRDPMLTGEPIVESKVVHAGAGGVMAVSLDPGMRAMAVPVSAESAAGGFILPGDHVDVVQSRQMDTSGGAKKFASGAVLRNVKVMAVDQNATRGQKSASVVGATATLEVTPAQAELLALSKSQGELTLILRSYADIAGGTSAGSGPRLAEEVNHTPEVVKVFRNGAPSDVAVAR
jgi:pilus assembly protein CpaB